MTVEIKETSFKVESERPEGGALTHEPLVSACVTSKKEDKN